MPALPESTDRALRALDALPATDGFVLAGGTALALRIEHRRSDDLDFVFASPKLPRRKLSHLLDDLSAAHSVKPFPNVAAEQEFLDTGLDLADYQQDYDLDGVKLTFFVPEPTKLGEALSAESGIGDLERIAIADLRSLFLMKAVALNSRITARDLFDVHTLIEHHGFGAAELFAAADRYGYDSDTLKTRLLGATQPPDDPGIEPITGAAPSFAQLKTYFAEIIDRLEQAEAQTSTSKRRSRRKRR